MWRAGRVAHDTLSIHLLHLFHLLHLLFLSIYLSLELCSAAAWAGESQVTGYTQLGLGVGLGVGLPCTATARAAGLESRAGLA